MRFEKINIESFGSIKGPFEYIIDSPGVNLILGPNGSGKTTILNALCWCLYKQTLKKNCTIDPWPHVIDKDYRGTMVDTQFRKGKDIYNVIRCKDYKAKISFNKELGKNGLFLFKNGVRINQKYKKDIQPIIENIIGYSFNLFKSSILFGQELERLIKESGPNKRRVFEEAFDTSFIEDAKNKVYGRLQDSERVEYELELNVGALEGDLQDFDSNTKKLMGQIIEGIRESRKELQKRKRELLGIKGGKTLSNEIRKNLIGLKKQKKKIEKRVNSNLVDDEFRLNMWMNAAASKIEGYKDELHSLMKKLSKVPEKCSYCGSELAIVQVNRVKKGIRKDMEDVKRGLIECKKEYKKLKADYEGIKKKLDNQDIYKKQIKKKETEINRLEEKLIKSEVRDSQKIMVKGLIKDVKNKIQKLLNKKLVLKENREKDKGVIVKKLETLKVRLKKVKKKNNIDKWLIKDPLSSNGIRSYIFDTMLQQVNHNLKLYSTDIGFNIKIVVDLESARKDIGIVILKGGDEVPYEDLSKGQKQLVDVSLAFAINDTVNRSKPVNALFMDEIFESLSKENIEIVGDIVLRKSKSRSIHIITHNTNFYPPSSKKLVLSLNSKGHTIAVG